MGSPPQNQLSLWQQRFPGLLLIVAIAGLISIIFPNGIWLISPVVISLLTGLFIRNTIQIAPKYKAGINYTVKTLLKVAIILLGIRFNFQQLLQLGFSGLLLILVCIAAAALATFLMAKALRVSPRLATLIGVGTVICGNSAIMATAPVIRADDEEVAVAVSTITIFGMLAVIIYPLIGNMLQLSDAMFGFWAGTSINDTSQVVAAAFAYSLEAGEIATLVKLTRNLLMGPIIVLISFFFARQQDGTENISMAKVFPWFVLGFVALATLNSFGIVSSGVRQLAQSISVFIIQMVLVGVGLNTDFRRIGKMGVKGFAVGLVAALAVSLFSICSIYLTQNWLLRPF
mgnify:FL=1|jgi:uncharacterized integral membrane protein (TIGR00698 family)